MFDIGMAELLVIGIVALIVVGPRDLPGLFRALGRFTGRARAMAREFQRAMSDAADQAGVKDMQDIAGNIRKVASPKATGLDALNRAADSFDKWQPPGRPAAKGPETQKLSGERTEAARKIREATARKAAERRAHKTAEATEPGPPATGAAKGGDDVSEPDKPSDAPESAKDSKR